LKDLKPGGYLMDVKGASLGFLSGETEWVSNYYVLKNFITYTLPANVFRTGVFQ
jgi:hypothetical protein